MFTQGLLNIMLLSNLKDRIVRGHPRMLRIPALPQPALRMQLKERLFIFSPFHFFVFFFSSLFIFCSAFAVFGQAHCGELCGCLCVYVHTLVYAWLRGNGITATQLIRSVSLSPSPASSSSLYRTPSVHWETDPCLLAQRPSIVCPDRSSRLSQGEEM